MIARDRQLESLPLLEDPPGARGVAFEKEVRLEAVARVRPDETFDG